MYEVCFAIYVSVDRVECSELSTNISGFDVKELGAEAKPFDIPEGHHVSNGVAFISYGAVLWLI